MKRGLVIVLALVAVMVVWAISMQRGLVSKDEGVNKAWADVQAAYQKRLDLVDNLVEIVKAEADFESETLKEVIEARSKAFQVNIDANQLTEENIQKLQQAQSGLSGALGKLAFLTESYPNLKANESYKKLQDNLVEIENQIKVERRNFNAAVQIYNTTVRVFPTNIMAGMMGFERKGSFSADEGADKAPKINMKRDKN